MARLTIVDLAGDVHEPAVPGRHLRLELVAPFGGQTEDPGEGVRRAGRILDLVRVDRDRARRHGQGELVAVAVEDRAPLGGQYPVPGPLLGGRVAQRVPVRGLQQPDPDEHRAEDQEHRDERADQPASRLAGGEQGRPPGRAGAQGPPGRAGADPEPAPSASAPGGGAERRHGDGRTERPRGEPSGPVRDGPTAHRGAVSPGQLGGAARAGGDEAHHGDAVVSTAAVLAHWCTLTACDGSRPAAVHQ